MNSCIYLFIYIFWYTVLQVEFFVVEFYTCWQRVNFGIEKYILYYHCHLLWIHMFWYGKGTGCQNSKIQGRYDLTSLIIWLLKNKCITKPNGPNSLSCLYPLISNKDTKALKLRGHSEIFPMFYCRTIDWWLATSYIRTLEHFFFPTSDIDWTTIVRMKTFSVQSET